MAFRDLVFRVGRVMGIWPAEQPMDDYAPEDYENEYPPEPVTYQTPYGDPRRQAGSGSRRQPSPQPAPQTKRTNWDDGVEQGGGFGNKKASYPRDNMVKMPSRGQGEESMALARKHSQIIIYVRRIEDAQEIINAVLDGQSVFLNLEEMDEVSHQRIIDMLGGATFALRGTIMKISHRAYLIAPPSVDVINSGDTGMHQRRGDQPVYHPDGRF